ncbi:hypothetical protein ABZ313_35625 [Streptomyces sp. NPDC006251]|uniref:hypothetical protein n=1 Tax=Streptomyces sp. NPDC006251 TaxID=3155718 RepID=UPI0033B40458
MSSSPVLFGDLRPGQWVRCIVALPDGKSRDEYGLIAVRTDIQRLTLWSPDRLGGVTSPRSLIPSPDETFYRAQRGEGLTEQQTDLIEQFATHGVYDRKNGKWILSGSQAPSRPHSAPAPSSSIAPSGNRVPSPETVREIKRELIVPRLVARAERLKLTADDLDALVAEAVHKSASQEFNDGAHTGLAAHEAFDAVHDGADARITAINNSGLEGQLWFLAECFGEQAVHDLLERQAGGSAADS